jgi:DNA-binding NarL/FixJ family response regulator/two-component sensor histidine kinase
MEHERAEVEHERAAVLAERNRLAREVHDVLAHTLGALSIQLEALDAQLDALPEVPRTLSEGVQRTKSLAADGLVEARRAVRALRDDAPPLVDQVVRLCELRGAQLVVLGGPRPLAAEATLALYRAAQEALTNAAKHAPGAPVILRLSFEEATVSLAVENGAGEHPLGELAGSGDGYGIDGIRERVRLLGGEVAAGPVGQGWRAGGEAAGMRVLIADDQRVVRKGLATILSTLAGIEVVATAADGAEAVGLAVEHRPDVVLMDLRMPGMDGVEATAAISARSPDIKVVVLTTYADDESVLAALGAGAVGYLTKDAGRDDIGRAIHGAAAGQSVLDQSVQARLLEAARSRPTRPASLPDGLTEREAEVLGLIAKGCSNNEIAAQLYVGEATVKTHINRIFAKTASRDRAQAAAYAHRHGLAG